MKKDICDFTATLCHFMVPLPVIEVGEKEFQLSSFLRAYWFLFIFVSIFTALTAFLTQTFSGHGSREPIFELLGIPFDLQEISIASCLLITYLGVFALLWAAFAEPRDRPIFYYFIGVEAFKRLLLVIPLVVLMLTLTTWINLVHTQVMAVIFSLIGFCLGIVVFSSILVLVSRNTRIRRFVLATMTYALVVFVVSLASLLAINLRSVPLVYTPAIFFIYAMGISSVFYIIATLIFEIILPLFQGWK
ncbi:MAG: hypothetical protein A4E36_02200 [Methanoregulaceae archaeon PtaB.Bin009]|nr:MAG: hypothetical protein A4E36_02200 [Methanoregulaceae archaeon PtaB.Bin009]OPY37976.1 MAG: hypothetical protein A4E41_01977 [Methanoregulaceae archaeon PtaU1.Bin066]HNQ28974.1 hypothetical protein [Methanolinea sp.]HNS82368.1 hypothetical protein [Methanolinea sp.]